MTPQTLLRQDRVAAAGLDDRPLGPVFEAAFDVLEVRVHLLVVRGTSDLLDDGRARATELLDLWFGPESELDRVAAADGGPVTVSPETLLLADVARRPAGEVLPDPVGGGPERTLVTDDGGTVRLPVAALAELAVLAPALVADLVARELVDGGALGACARVGDDAAMLGVPPRLAGWRVEVLDGYGGTTQVLVGAGGVASRGRWSGSRATTVTAPTAWQAARRATHATSPIPDPR